MELFKLYPDIIVCILIAEGILLVCDDCICAASNIFILFLCLDEFLLLKCIAGN